MSVNSYLCHFIFIAMAQSLQITNITSSVALTSIFYNDSSFTSLIELDIGFMTYYIDPKDTSQTKHLWLGTNQRINDTALSEVHTNLQSDIFYSDFAQYNPSNNNIKDLLPITISNSSDKMNNQSDIDDVFVNVMCTSPTTNDVMTCWFNVTENVEHYIHNIQCRIFFVATNTFSDVINITAPYNHEDAKEEFNYPSAIICFHDSYWIPYTSLIYPIIAFTPYSALIDLNGNIIFAQRNLGLNYSGIIWNGYGTEGKTLHQIGNKEYETFALIYPTYNELTNISNITAAYGYYTDINDSSPIHIYENHDINHQYNPAIYKGQSPMEPWVPLSINFTDNCCYISIYSVHVSDNTDKLDIYGIFTDNNGNALNISGQSYFKDILLLKNANLDVNPLLFDLPMISTDSSHYFMITFGNSTTGDHSNTIMAKVFYLTYSDQSTYNLMNTGVFSTVQLVNQQINFQGYFGYIMPGTNKLFYSWIEAGSSYLAYGQTWTIN
eukprot:139861_1